MHFPHVHFQKCAKLLKENSPMPPVPTPDDGTVGGAGVNPVGYRVTDIV